MYIGTGLLMSASLSTEPYGWSIVDGNNRDSIVAVVSRWYGYAAANVSVEPQTEVVIPAKVVGYRRTPGWGIIHQLTKSRFQDL